MSDEEKVLNELKDHKVLWDEDSRILNAYIEKLESENSILRAKYSTAKRRLEYLERECESLRRQLPVDGRGMI